MKRCLVCGACFEDENWKCSECGHFPKWRDGIYCFVDPATAAEAGFNPEYFVRLAGLEEGNFWFRMRNRLIQWALRAYFPQARNFFEIGCGTGFVLSGLRQTFPQLRLAASEIFRDGLTFAQRRVPEAQLYQMDARQIPFAEEFDVIGAFDVLEHIAEDEIVLAEMFRAVRPGGGLLITVPQHRFLWSASDTHSMHQRRYQRADLRGKVLRAGFRIARITSFVSLLLPLMLLSRMKRSRSQNFDLWREFKISPRLNTTLGRVLALEHKLIAAGISFPLGGSLLLVARKPAITP